MGRQVAQRIGAQIVSLDSMKIYRGMDIGTAKPDATTRGEVVHHLIDICEPHEPYSVADYLTDAAEAGARIEAAGDLPLFVGGTAMYLKALLEGLVEAPAADLAYRETLVQQARDEGIQALHARLEQVDAPSAGRIHPNDQRRVIRALEYHHATGRPISAVRTQWAGPPKRAAILVGLRWPRSILLERIDRRVERMFAMGLADEVQQIQSQGGFGRESSQAIGYKEVLSAGSPEAAMESIQRRTRQFAKRQMTWFRRFSAIHWIDVAAQTDLEHAVDEAVAVLASQ